jgi:hypothetical protein
MPRIEIIPVGWETSPERARGDGTPTIDVCALCAERIQADAIAHVGDIDHVLEGFDDADRIGETAVAHPGFDGEGYRCEICNNPLTAADD